MKILLDVDIYYDGCADLSCSAFLLFSTEILRLLHLTARHGSPCYSQVTSKLLLQL